MSPWSERILPTAPKRNSSILAFAGAAAMAAAATSSVAPNSFIFITIPSRTRSRGRSGNAAPPAKFQARTVRNRSEAKHLGVAHLRQRLDACEQVAGDD